MRNLLLFLALLAGATLAQPEFRQETDMIMPQLEPLYKWFHANPELSSAEVNTARRLAEELEKLGLEVTTGIGGTGLIALLKNGKGPVVLYRADMDALPITESTGLPYASQNDGVMHACGHDIHMTCAVGALAVLSRMKDQWAGTIVFIGQPAEETGAGARAILSDPKFAQILASVGKPEMAIALHDYANVPAGAAALTPGFVTANVDSVDITVFGKGGHGAAPDTTIDPIVIGAEIVTALQTIISRRLPPGTRAVVTVGKFQGGTKRNIIPSEAQLELTVRSYEEEIRTRLMKEIERTARGVAEAQGATQPPKIYHHKENYTPAGYNDPGLAQRLRPVFLDVLGESNLKEMPPSMVGEDFSRYSKALEIPGVMFLLGAADPDALKNGETLPPLHSDRFAPAYELTIRTGVNLVVASLLEVMRP
jgi:amidohydrolase